ncbi:hypothetical protein BDK51DRAFT_43101 [Blyttiomyces helicus]|uniref:Uncharacterized protein n=1 Tax=Blyttiomyces helicus TaxID=388810 RepID=A0A4P9W1Y8_9FUNG|nr:hypothetical protein BDK51DRAFT_43101 [Blyttiomyces helicus]|eukprot:RKO85183.1 hypothetical protein BDK51DRAFT_43101 [Blyttiomyces helicus]
MSSVESLPKAAREDRFVASKNYLEILSTTATHLQDIANSSTNGYPGSFTWFKGMPFICTKNSLGRNLGLTNGTEVFAEGVILHPSEQPLPMVTGIIPTLTHLPVGLVIHAPSLQMIDSNNRRKPLQLDGLPPSTFILTPTITTFAVKRNSPRGANTGYSSHHPGPRIHGLKSTRPHNGQRHHRALRFKLKTQHTS